MLLFDNTKSGVVQNVFDSKEITCSYTMSYQTSTHGYPLIIKSHLSPKEGSAKERGLNFAATFLFNA